MRKKRCPYCGKKVYISELRCSHCREWIDTPAVEYEKVSGLKRQNFVLAKILSLLLYPTMCYFIPPVIIASSIQKEPELLQRLLQISLICTSLFVVFAVLFHLKKYLSNFWMEKELITLIRQTRVCFTLEIFALIGLVIFTNENTFVISMVIATGSFFIGVFLLYLISSKIANTRNVFVEGVEDFSRLHIEKTNIVVEHTIPLYGFYAAFATPWFLYRMFSKAEKYSNKYGFNDNLL